MNHRATGLRPSRGFALCLVIGILVVGLLNLLPLSWGTAQGATIPPTSTPAPAPPAPTATPTPGAPLPSSAIAPAFVLFLQSFGVNGVAALGSPISPPLPLPFTPQYFEKARLEDHSATETDPVWKTQFGLLMDEMQALCAGALQSTCANLPVGGEQSTETYAMLAAQADASTRLPPPAGFGGGVLILNANSASCVAFIPYDADLRPAPGHDVPCGVWTFMAQRKDVFPLGWLHDLGLPITESLSVTVTKDGEAPRQITLQFFQRGYITNDPLNPAGWQLELGNAGTDRVKLSNRTGATLFGTQ